jgi:NhaP-type Na+/H+ or K+/H+ antiporter
VFATSGVLATLTMGVLVKMFGRSMFNDTQLLEGFWGLLEHLLNSVLFTLGGAVWGEVITNGEVDHRGFFGKDWGYLVVLYLYLHVIRLFMFVVIYPITVRIGLKTNWNETIFQVYSGLRGAVGIALAIFLDHEVRLTGAGGSEAPAQTDKIFGFVGGVAFLTLCINGVTAGPLLRRLHLADSTTARAKIVDAYQTRYVMHLTGMYHDCLNACMFFR